MRPWQKYWLVILIFLSLTHILRDIFQDLGIRNFLSVSLVKERPLSDSALYWSFFNTYLFAVLEIFLAIYCIFGKRFGKMGYLSIILAVILILAWIYYYFVL